jgi:RNA polymerase sigma-70 factor (ECF subfamily)
MGTDKVDTAEQDQADMERLAAGHDAALDALMERHAGHLFQFLFRMIGDEEEANDLAQETFVRVYRHRQNYNGGKFTTWLYTIAGNLARGEFRRRSRHPNVSLEQESENSGGKLSDTLPARGSSPSESLQAGERARAVREAVDGLPAELKEAIVLCEWQELSAAEAAEVLNTTSRGIESKLYRARKLLREALEKWI